MSDNVNHPSHYTGGSIECIEAIEEATKELCGIEAVCTANAIKYLWRWKRKNGLEDLKKAVWYINRIIEEKEKQDHTTLELLHIRNDESREITAKIEALTKQLRREEYEKDIGL